MTVKEVAALVGVTPLTVRNWDKAGHLSAYRNPVNNYRLYKIEDVELLMKKIEASQSRPSLSAVKTSVRKLTIEEL